MKFNLAILTIALAFSLVACGGGKKKDAKASSATKKGTKTEGVQQKVVAGPNGELRVVDSTSVVKVKEIVVGADGKLQVVERDVPGGNCAPRNNCNTRRCR